MKNLLVEKMLYLDTYVKKHAVMPFYINKGLSIPSGATIFKTYIFFYDSLEILDKVLQASKNKDIDELEKLAMYSSKDYDKNNIFAYASLSGNIKTLEWVMRSVYEDYYKEKILPSYMAEVEKEFIKHKQSSIAKQKRNKFHSMAVEIMRLTWKKYPCASKNEMCKKIYEFFNGGISISTLERAIKEEGLLPPKPKRYTSFELVTP